MIAVKYLVFAAIATAINLLAQYFSLVFYHGWGALQLAMLNGTAVGLISKYILDKHYIFYQPSESVRQDARKFAAYTITGIVTTLIFWGTELSFDQLFNTVYAKYLGAILGLSIGYLMKYQLDKKYVFKEPVR